MDVTSIVQIISSLGFPTAAAFYMAWLNQRQSIRHSEEIREWRKVVEQNTLTVQRLADKLDLMGGERNGGN